MSKFLNWFTLFYDFTAHLAHLIAGITFLGAGRFFNIFQFGLAMRFHLNLLPSLNGLAAVLADLVARVALLGAGGVLGVLQLGFPVRIGVDGDGDFLGAGVFLAAEGRLRGVNCLARRNAGRRRRLADNRRVHNGGVIAARRARERGRRGPRPTSR